MRVPDTCPLPPGSTVWGYLRDSGGDRQDRSVEQQRAVLVDYCQQHRLVLERVFSDAARAGDSADQRAALWDMLNAARERFPPVHDRRRREEIAARLRHGVVFWTFARLGRDRVETSYIRNDLRMRGLVVTSLADEILTGNEDLDPILEEMLAFKAQLDLRVISAEAKRGLHDVVSLRDTDPVFLQFNPGWQPTGRYLSIFPGRVIPRGFRAERIVIGKRRDGSLRRVQRLVPDPETWDRARLAWRMRVLDQATYPRIHEATGLYGALASYSSFFGNPLYTGVFHAGDEAYGAPEDPFVEPLIPVEWYELEQERRAKRAAHRRKGGRQSPGLSDTRTASSPYLLSGLLVCARCGSRMHAETIPGGTIRTTGQRRKPWPFYRCSRASNGGCDAGKVSARLIEGLVVSRLTHDVLSPAQLARHLDELAAHLDTTYREQQERLAALRQQLTVTDRHVHNLVDALAERPASSALLQRLDEAEAEQRRLTQAIRTIEARLAAGPPSLGLTADELAAMAAQALDNLAHPGEDKENARRTLAAFIDRVEVEPGQRITAHIYYRVAVPLLVQGLSKVPPRGLEPLFQP